MRLATISNLRGSRYHPDPQDAAPTRTGHPPDTVDERKGRAGSWSGQSACGCARDIPGVHAIAGAIRGKFSSRVSTLFSYLDLIIGNPTCRRYILRRRIRPGKVRYCAGWWIWTDPALSLRPRLQPDRTLRRR